MCGEAGLLEMGVQEGGGGAIHHGMKGGGVSPPELEAGAGGDAEEGTLGGVRGASNKAELWVVDGVMVRSVVPHP